MGFQSFNFHSSINKNLEQGGYVTPTPIQQQAIPEVLAEKDVLGLAQTGTGKTAAFVLPILQNLLQKGEQDHSRDNGHGDNGRGENKHGDGRRRNISSLIICPTRELADQIHGVVKQFSAGTKIRSTVVYGGVSMFAQEQRLRQGVDILVACPGRLLDHLQRKTLKLNAVQHFVLDEADRLFDMGFLPTIREIIKRLPTQRQSLLFSATMPKEVQHLVETVLKNPVRISINNAKPLTTISHAFYQVGQEQKIPLLLTLLKDLSWNSVLVFTRTKHRAKRVAHQLAQSNFRVASLQGNLSQQKRQAAIEGFRRGKFEILVATDIASRGIDVASVSHVINFDIPDTVEAYTHRIGRTGRASREGDALTFITNQDRAMVRHIERAMNTQIERRELDLPNLPREQQQASPAGASTSADPSAPNQRKSRGGRSWRNGGSRGNGGNGRNGGHGRNRRRRNMSMRSEGAPSSHSAENRY